MGHSPDMPEVFLKEYRTEYVVTLAKKYTSRGLLPRLEGYLLLLSTVYYYRLFALLLLCTITVYYSY